jgi:iron-sulfur cluster assembly accessory protein
VLFFENEKDVEETDHIFEFDGVKVFVDMASMQYLEDTTIDYTESMMTSGFKFTSEHIKSTCGCGSSFNM